MSNTDMNATPSGERVRIALCGRRNAGKSSLINAIAGQNVAIVSDIAGTTTDPVRKSIELLPLGPVILVDTAGTDDEGTLGTMRVDRTINELRIADIGIIVTDAQTGIGEYELQLANSLRNFGTAFLLVVNKSDIYPATEELVNDFQTKINAPVYVTSSYNGSGIDELKKAISEIKIDEPESQHIISDKMEKGEVAVLVVPIDSAAPKGRLILPQQQTIRDLLDKGCRVVVTQVDQLADSLNMLKAPPRIVITDSQAFKEVREIVPQEVELTSFSILFAKYKGNYEVQKAGADAIDTLQDGDRILISEGCTHRRQCDDIGTVKLPKWLLEYTGKNLVIDHTSGMGWKDDLTQYKLIIHCGACMLNRKEIRRRINDAISAKVPITNYGIAIAKLRKVNA